MSFGFVSSPLPDTPLSLSPYSCASVCLHSSIKKKPERGRGEESLDGRNQGRVHEPRQEEGGVVLERGEQGNRECVRNGVIAWKHRPPNYRISGGGCGTSSENSKLPLMGCAKRTSTAKVATEVCTVACFPMAHCF